MSMLGVANRSKFKRDSSVNEHLYFDLMNFKVKKVLLQRYVLPSTEHILSPKFLNFRSRGRSHAARWP
ncbi:hypothetical protein T11_7936 [Trichinella zimbabwensis]|uniref:Uncharacterized protein n=1 Tax=Trichinella zimbabwensis TaxID=268475 RepID=A0A0V1GS34_9BILA|nr:hypothetical protein T11_7936 [Trichinella zimbabwensis]